VKKTVIDLLAPFFVAYNQWRIKGGADWATARGLQHLGGPQFLSRKKVYCVKNTQCAVKNTIANWN